MQLCVFGLFPKVAHPLHEKSAKDGALCKVNKKKNRNPFGFRHFLVEVTGFEPATFWSRTKRATKLRYTSKDGANEGTRTPDLLITNQLLYRLSYIGTSATAIITKAQAFVQHFFAKRRCAADAAMAKRKPAACAAGKKINPWRAGPACFRCR